ncbi:IclR family transcriptional regulator C-terminal domain-containing protein [Streptomyces sp. NPDC049837]|uniref:IclR family transcriptional regulator domain-containing protein n=1 Tax=Streptomyces sp. NPDC049837 TaxID=3155277 RepID=UPI00343E5C58
MSDVSGYDGPRGEYSEPTVPAGLTDLLRELEGTRDFWDRPYGTCDPDAGGDAEEERARANSFYRLGTKALRRDELGTAADWLGRAAERDHPGALFRLAVVVHRRFGAEGRDDARFLVAEAARHGHGDAGALLCEATAGAGRRLNEVQAQDPEFIDDVRAALGLSRTPSPPVPMDPPAAGAPAADNVRAPTPPAPVAPVTPTPSAAPAGGLWVPGRTDGRSRLWTPAPLRSASLTSLAQQVPAARESAQRWKEAMRVLDVLDAIGSADGPVSAARIAHGTGMDAPALEHLLAWLSQQGLVAAAGAGAYTAGPLMRVLSGHRGAERENALREVLSDLRDTVGAAVYVSTYTDGEVRITQYADGPSTPAVYEWVDFREAAHASAVGKSLLAQLDFEGRMDHLHRRRPVPLTPRTITDHRHLFHALDHHGPQAAQFDLLEYSNDEVCVAFPLTLAGRAGAVALSLPVARQHRLLEAADALSNRSASLLATLLLAADPPDGTHGAGATDATDTTDTSDTSDTSDGADTSRQPVGLGTHAGGGEGARDRHGR